jgi:hypothetical protein
VAVDGKKCDDLGAAFESQTDRAVAESSGQDRSIPVIEGWRRRKSDMIGSAAGGRVEGAA